MNMIDPISSDPLARRLSSLAIPVPPFVHGPAVVAAPHPRPHTARRLGLATLAAVVAVLASTAAAFPSVVTNLSQEALRIAGLTPAQVSPAQGEAHHGTASLSVHGTYADSVSTVVFAAIKLDDMPCEHAAAADAAVGRCGESADAPYLVDQFGERYAVTGGEGIDVGPYAIFFQPVRGQALATGAHLTLHLPVSRYDGAVKAEQFDLSVALSGAVTPKTATPLPPQPAVVDGARGVRYELLGATASGVYLRVHTRLTGNLDAINVKLGADGMGGTAGPGVFLVDASGRYEIPIAGGGDHVWDAHTQEESRVFAVRGPGAYRIVVNRTTDPGAVPPGPSHETLAEWPVVIK